MSGPKVVDKKLTGPEVTSAIWQHFTSQSWAGLAEVTVRGPQYSMADWKPGDIPPWQREENRDRRIDLLMMRSPRKQGLGSLERLAIEVKVSRGDFLSDVANPHKQAPWRELTHRHAYAVPAGMVKPSEVPAASGLLYVSTFEGWGGKQSTVVKWEKRAPYTDTNPEVPDWLALTAAYRASWAEGRSKGWVAGMGDDDVEALRLEVTRLRRSESNLQNKVVSMTEQRDEWRRLAGISAATVEIPCEHCSLPVVAKTVSARWGLVWKHAAKADEETCAGMRGLYAKPQPDPSFDPSQLVAVTA